MGDEVDLVVRGGTILTVDPDRRVLADSSIAVKDGLIHDIGPAHEIADRYRARQTLGGAADVVTPGFVDAHVHLSHHLGRTSIPDTWPEAREHDHWLPYWRNLSEEDAYHSAMLACMEMARNGTTTFCDMSGRFSGEIQASAADRIGLRGIISEVCWDQPPYPDVGVGDTAACIARLESLIDRFPKRPDRRLWAGVGMSGMGKCSDPLVVAGSDLARARGLPLYMHQSFAAADVSTYKQMSGGSSPVAHLGELGVLGPHLQLVHMIHTDLDEVDLLAASGTSVIHCPAASVRWGLGVSRFSHFPEMVAKGVNVGLGSDSGNYSDFLDIGRQAYLAATIHREHRGVTATITAEQAIEMATLGGARAIGMGDAIGSIEIGKRADLVVHDGRRPEWHPLQDAASTLVYAAQSSAVRHVVIDGRTVLEDGAFKGFDEVAALAAIDAAARGLTQRMAVDIPRPWPRE
jgi:cytosine/adenosine deaminase-related metal-dependent hydrolase